MQEAERDTHRQREAQRYTEIYRLRDGRVGIRRATKIERGTKSHRDTQRQRDKEKRSMQGRDERPEISTETEPHRDRNTT